MDAPPANAAHRAAVGRQRRDPRRAGLAERALIPLERLRVVLPVAVADYVDFYSSIEHASNAGRIFRPDAEPLAPNWRWLPVGYHGRAATVVVSGTPVRRPCGQRAPEQAGRAADVRCPSAGSTSRSSSGS